MFQEQFEYNTSSFTIKKEELPDIGVNSVLLNYTISSAGRRKTVPVKENVFFNEDNTPNGFVLTDAEAPLVSAGKEILDSVEVAAIRKCDNQLRANLRRVSLPSHKAIKGGFLRIPLILVPEVNRIIKDYIAVRSKLVENLIERLPSIIEADKKSLKSLFQQEDYPSPDELRSAYTVFYQFSAFTIPETLMEAGIYEQERSKAQEQLQTVVQECQDALRTELANMVKHAATKLTVAEGETPKIFRDSMIEKIEGFLNYFEARNITNDTQLAEVVDQVKKTMSGIESTDTLRTDDELRASIAEEFSTISQVMEENIISRPSRKMKLPAA